MAIWHINGGNRLDGACFVQGSKNAVLPILAASVISPCETELLNVPQLSDVSSTLRILRQLGCTAEQQNNDVYIDSRNLSSCTIPQGMMECMRSSVLFMGTLLARCGQVRLTAPGGCKLGAYIDGAGTNMITVSGFAPERHVGHRIIPDRIAASTFLCACAAAGGDIELRGVDSKQFLRLQHFLNQAGCDIISSRRSVRLRSDGCLHAVSRVVTEPYPGFPTDAQPILMAALLKARGMSRFTENIFDSRFCHAAQLMRFGADIAVDGREATVWGVRSLRGATVTATDLRGGAAMVIAGLSAEGSTSVIDAGHIARGYENFDNKLRSLGADVFMEI